jgi:hypothetical protein
MNRIQNHIEGGISDVYDQHEYAEENMHVMETVASKIMSLVEGGVECKVIPFGARCARATSCDRYAARR